jgi:hypothetical protein
MKWECSWKTACLTYPRENCSDGFVIIDELYKWLLAGDLDNMVRQLLIEAKARVV